MTPGKKPSSEEIVRILVGKTGDFFEEPGSSLSVDIRVTLRITVEFHEFLQQQVDQPDPSEISYVMDTIRSGIDHFFLVKYSVRVIQGVEESWLPEDRLSGNFAEAKISFLRLFELLTRESSTAVEQLTSLLSLIRIQLAFLAYYFPWGEAP